MFKKVAFVAALVLVAASPSDASITVGKNEDANIRVKAGTGRTDTITYPGASYISVRFSDFNLPAGDEVIVRSPDSKTVHRYTGKGRNNVGSFISPSVPGDKAIVEYISKNKLVDSRVPAGYSIPGFARGYADTVQVGERGHLCGTDQTAPVKCFKEGKANHDLPQAYNKARAVARLLVNGTRSCSAWLAGSEGHLITTQSCVWDTEVAKFTEVEFDAESASCGDDAKIPMGRRGTVVSTTPNFVTADGAIDYAVLKLHKDEVSKYGYLQFRGSGPRVGEQIYIPQYPMGYPKRIVYMQENGKIGTIESFDSIVNCGDNQVGYSLDTYGSYGAPVLSSKDNLVVALDHCEGCVSYGVHPAYIFADLTSKNIVIKDLYVGATPSGPVPTPRINCMLLDNRRDCEAYNWCEYHDESEINCQFKNPADSPYIDCKLFDNRRDCEAYNRCEYHDESEISCQSKVLDHV